MAKRSPSGIHLPIIDQAYDQKPTLTLVDGGSVTLVRDVMNYTIVKSAAPLDNDTTVLLPAAPSDGDEVVLASLITFVDPLTDFLILDGNGKMIGIQPLPAATFNVDTVAWVKYSLAEDIWVMLNCCVLVEAP